MDEKQDLPEVVITARSNNNQITPEEQNLGHKTCHGNLCQGVHSIFQKYCYQLLFGCRHKDCTETLCHTGRKNTSTRPLRPYTGLSARQVALFMCSNPYPTKHICRHLPEIVGKPETDPRKHPKDPSSLPQLLCDTNVIKDIYYRAPSVTLDSELVRLHQDVSEMLKFAGRLPNLNGKKYLSNAQLVDGLFSCFDWLISQAPTQRMGSWKMINRDIISKGYAYPSRRENMPVDAQYNTWLAILDTLDHEPFLRLLERMMGIVSRRRALEESLYALDPEHGEKFVKVESSVEHLLAKRLYSKKAPTEVFSVIVWLKKLFTKTWDSKPTVKHGSACFGILQTMKSLLECRPAAILPEWPEETFRMPMIWVRIISLELTTPFMNPALKDNEKPILNWSFLFPQDQLSMAFRTINHFVMRQANSDVEKAIALRRRFDPFIYIPDPNYYPEQIQHSEKHYLLLTVGRQSALTNTFNQLWQRRRDELRRPLRVRLGETDQLEIGHDLGGVQMEFFNLVCKQAFADEAGMFTTDPTTGCSYILPGSLQPLHMFEMIGTLIALALYNGITLPICLPRVFYTFLMKTPKDIGKLDLKPEDIRDMFPVVAKSLQQVIDEDVPGLEFAYPLEANGLSLTVVEAASMPWRKHTYCMKVTDATPTDFKNSPDFDLISTRNSWPGWQLVKAGPHRMVEEVTAENKATYVTNYVEFLSYRSVAPQVDALLEGFHSAGLFAQSRALTLFTPDQLKAHLEGSSVLDINDLRESAKYDGYDPKSKYIQGFWKFVAAWPEAKQRQLLKFVTAAERIPITGAKHLTFIIKKVMPESKESLPTSSTCFGTLMLPRYHNVEMMARKLSLALEYGSEGFGTG